MHLSKCQLIQSCNPELDLQTQSLDIYHTGLPPKVYRLFLFNGSSWRPCVLQGLEDGGSCGIKVASGRSVWTPWRWKVRSGMFPLWIDISVLTHWGKHDLNSEFCWYSCPFVVDCNPSSRTSSKRFELIWTIASDWMTLWENPGI